MKHILKITALSVAFAVPAWAGYIAGNTPLCISERTLETYMHNVESNQADFNRDLLDRAACYIQLDVADVALLSERRGVVEVRLASGHSAWGEAAAYSVEKPAPKTPELKAIVVQTAVIGGDDAQSVAEKSSWFDKMRSYWPF